MKVCINEKEYEYKKNAMKDYSDRESYFHLTQNIFNLDFGPWYESGYADDSFIPYTLYDGHIAVASVGVVTSEFRWKNKKTRFSQISTVMTLPKYRGNGLNRWLLESALEEYRSSDLIYLYANDSVCSYYPRFGFERMTEYAFHMPVIRGNGSYRKLDLKNPIDVALLTEKYMNFNNPFSALTMEHNLSQMMFHCITFLYDNIYYMEQYDAVVIAAHEADTIFCYDIYSSGEGCISDILSTLATENTTSVVLGFTPMDAIGFVAEPSKEPDTTIFTLKSPVNPFKEDQVTFPFMSRA